MSSGPSPRSCGGATRYRNTRLCRRSSRFSARYTGSFLLARFLASSAILSACHLTGSLHLHLVVGGVGLHENHARAVGFHNGGPGRAARGEKMYPGSSCRSMRGWGVGFGDTQAQLLGVVAYQVRSSPLPVISVMQAQSIALDVCSFRKTHTDTSPVHEKIGVCPEKQQPVKRSSNVFFMSLDPAFLRQTLEHTTCQTLEHTNMPCFACPLRRAFVAGHRGQPPTAMRSRHPRAPQAYLLPSDPLPRGQHLVRPAVDRSRSAKKIGTR